MSKQLVESFEAAASTDSASQYSLLTRSGNGAGSEMPLGNTQAEQSIKQTGELLELLRKIGESYCEPIES